MSSDRTPTPSPLDTPGGSPDASARWLDRVRLAHTGLAVALVFMGIVAMHVGAAMGSVDRRGLTAWTAASSLSFVVVYFLIRRGHTARFKDPSLTFVQIILAVTTGAWAYVLAGTSHAVVTLMLTMALSFGSFGITPRQLLGCAAYAVVAFGTVMLRQCLVDPVRFHPVDDLLLFVFLVLIIIGGVINTIRVNGMRMRLRDQRARLEDAMAQVNELALRDPLTGLHNRRCVLELMELERAKAARAGTPWSVVLIDIDHFKSINDTFGHATGDQVLVAFAETMRQTLRESDVVGRWGGEEFVVVMPQTALSQAIDGIDRLRAAFAATPLQGLSSRPVTFSAGVAEWEPALSIEQNVAQADAYCYAAKRGGRDRTESARARLPARADAVPA